MENIFCILQNLTSKLLLDLISIYLFLALFRYLSKKKKQSHDDLVFGQRLVSYELSTHTLSGAKDCMLFVSEPTEACRAL